MVIHTDKQTNKQTNKYLLTMSDAVANLTSDRLQKNPEVVNFRDYFMSEVFAIMIGWNFFDEC